MLDHLAYRFSYDTFNATNFSIDKGSRIYSAMSDCF